MGRHVEVGEKVTFFLVLMRMMAVVAVVVLLFLFSGDGRGDGAAAEQRRRRMDELETDEREHVEAVSSLDASLKRRRSSPDGTEDGIAVVHSCLLAALGCMQFPNGTGRGRMRDDLAA